ncbi:E motif [Dillenia turbinata]|uniref:E motif n=1 Tax=Dillenia turbinata TaxID=194707 RepID=A0AAN8V601_9MAGN
MDFRKVMYYKRSLNQASRRPEERFGKKPFYGIRCSSLVEKDLRPRPRPAPRNVDVNDSEKPNLERPQIRNSSSGLGKHIEKLVLRKKYQEAFELFEIIQSKGEIDLDFSTFDALVDACISLKSITGVKRVFNYVIVGRLLHSCALKKGMGGDIFVACALIDMYSKCRSIVDARTVGRNAIIGGDALHGYSEEALDMYYEMRDSGVKMDHFTIALVDFDCKWGRLEDARMSLTGCQEKNVISWNALIAGYANHVQQKLWAALLTAARVHKNFEFGKFAAEKLHGMEPEKFVNYILLLNIYNSSGKLKEAASVVQTLKRKGLRMVPAFTWIELKKQSRAFLSGDKCHVQTEEVSQKLDELMLEISQHGYVPQPNSLLPDVDEQEEQKRQYHSEKLAIALGLINTSD